MGEEPLERSENFECEFRRNILLFSQAFSDNKSCLLYILKNGVAQYRCPWGGGLGD